MTLKIGIIGDGHVGAALRDGLQRAGYAVKAVGREPAGIKDTGAWADVVILAVPYGAVGSAVEALGDTVRGKVLVDATNPLTGNMQLAAGCTNSGAEQLQAQVPGARVVKAFNNHFAQNMTTGTVKGQAVSILAAGDDAAAKAQVVELARAIGFDAIDAGPLKNARYIEPLAYLTIQLGYSVGLGLDIGFRLVR